MRLHRVDRAERKPLARWRRPALVTECHRVPGPDAARNAEYGRPAAVSGRARGRVQIVRFCARSWPAGESPRLRAAVAIATSRLRPGSTVTGRGTVLVWVNRGPRRLGALRSPCSGSRVRALPDSAPLCAVRHRSADRVDRVVRDEEVGVRPGRAEGVVARSRERRAFLPPAVLGGDHRGIERCVELRLHVTAPAGVSRRTHSSSSIFAAVAVAGWISRNGSRAWRRSRGRLRCPSSQYCSRRAKVSVSGYSSMVPGRAEVAAGSQTSGSGAWPALAKLVE